MGGSVAQIVAARPSASSVLVIPNALIVAVTLAPSHELSLIERSSFRRRSHPRE
jgi:hypothetical protein